MKRLLAAFGVAAALTCVAVTAEAVNTTYASLTVSGSCGPGTLSTLAWRFGVSGKPIPHDLFLETVLYRDYYQANLPLPPGYIQPGAIVRRDGGPNGGYGAFTSKDTRQVPSSSAADRYRQFIIYYRVWDRPTNQPVGALFSISHAALAPTCK